MRAAIPIAAFVLCGAGHGFAMQTEVGRAILHVDASRIHSGMLVVTEGGELALDSESFAEPAVIDWTAIRSMQRLDDLARPMPVVPGEAGGDRLTALRGQRLRGRVRAIQDEAILFESRRFGPLVVPRSQAGMLTHVSGGASPGEGGPRTIEPLTSGVLAGTWATRDAKVTKEGPIDLSRFGSSAWTNVARTDERFSITLDWTGAPEFSIVIDGSADDSHDRKDLPELASGRDAVLVEPWGGRLVLVRWEGGVPTVRMTDVDLGHDSRGVITIALQDGSVRLESFVPSGGERVALEVSVPRAIEEGAPDRTIVELIGRGSGVVMTEFTRDPIRVANDDGRVELDRPVTADELLGFDAEARELTLAVGRASFDDSHGIQFVPKHRMQELFTLLPEEGFARLSTIDGEAIEVDFVTFENGVFRVKPRWRDDVCEIDPADVLELRLQVAPDKAEEDAFEYRIGTDRVRTSGFSGLDVTDGEPFVSRIEPGFSSVISTALDKPFTLKRATRSLFHVSRRKYPHDVVLSDGQKFPGQLVGVDGERIQVRTPFRREPIELDARAVKAVLVDPRRAVHVFWTLDASARETRQRQTVVVIASPGSPTSRDSTRLTVDEVDRALQVLRNQKDDPGTHLVVASNGDLLRTNIRGIDGESLMVEGGALGDAGAFGIPLDRVAAWVRVTPEVPIEEPERAPAAEGWNVDLDERTSFRATLVGGERGGLQFEHPVLGDIRVRLDEVQQLAYRHPFRTKQRAFMSWATRPIAEPLLTSDR